ncbi:MAG: hypothetical protein A4E19_12455 [Nitrospira sp. SG-bin1]|nr:MAG: hypothetical protein A4E19_12455 [Nitrospira sp. SG-bin1]
MATTGNDSNSGTEKTPFLTIHKAVNTMVAGDTTYVRGGLYVGAGVRFRRSGTAAAPIKLLNYPGESPIYQCLSNLTADGQMFLIQHGAGSINPIGWITIEGFEVRHCSRGVKFYNLHDSVIRRNWMHDTYNTPIQGNGARILIDRNIINDVGKVERAHGIYANGTAFTITNNLIYDVTYYGIQQNGSGSSLYDSTKHAGPEFAGAQNWVVAHNTFAYNGGTEGAAYVIWGRGCTNLRIENNIFYENAPARSNNVAQAIHFLSSQPLSGVTIRNNLSYATGSGGLGFIASGGRVEGVDYTQSGNVVNTDDPRFVNAPATLPASPNFALTERSPAIDKGVPHAAITTALDGTPRPQGHAYDIGAYEYKAGVDLKSPAAPIALQIH